jgi:hypothetical protein
MPLKNNTRKVAIGINNRSNGHMEHAYRAVLPDKQEAKSVYNNSIPLSFSMVNTNILKNKNSRRANIRKIPFGLKRQSGMRSITGGRKKHTTRRHRRY